MFGLNKNHKTIQVQFFENGSDKPFAQSAIPIEQLPDSFEVSTTLHIANVDWRVDHAEPANKAEFRKTGNLRIYLYKAKTITVAPSDLLFSLATISDILPNLVAAPLENIFVVHEDDWRQVELISRDFEHAVKEEFAAIRGIYENHRQGVAFKKLHVRKLIPTPLSGSALPLDEVKQIFGVAHEYLGVAFSSAAAVVDGGFAFRASNEAVLWGDQSETGLITTFCVSGHPELQFSQPMADFLNNHNLLFADWLRPPKVRPSA